MRRFFVPALLDDSRTQPDPQKLWQRHEAALSALSSTLGSDAPLGERHEELSVDDALDMFDAMARRDAGDRQPIELRDIQGRVSSTWRDCLGRSDRQALRLRVRALTRLGRHLRRRV